MGIFTDQVGFEPNEKKIIVTTVGGQFKLINEDTKAEIIVKKAEKILKEADPLSGDDTYIVDISEVNTEGRYRLYLCDEKGNLSESSDLFTIGRKIYTDLQRALSKALYFQRCGCALEEKYAGKYTHMACHTEPVIHLMDYVNKVENPKSFDLRGGWHDAGDYGRYSTAAAVALGHILYAYELFGDAMQGELNIPETGNGIPDILNECKYELDWLIKLQAEDGGVYHKLTAFTHAPFLMPEDDKDPFMLYPVSSMAVADYVAVMALASRVYAKYDPEFSTLALSKARKSFEWLTKNDFVPFENYPGSHTGEYGDYSDRDERLWAAAEMLRTDKEGNTEAYRKMFNEIISEYVPGRDSRINQSDGKPMANSVTLVDFGWGEVSGFASLCVLTDENHSAGVETETLMKKVIGEECSRLLKVMEQNGYKLAMGPDDFVWGSNMTLLSRCMLFALADIAGIKFENGINSKEVVFEQMHYLLGRNALNRSYVTGFGEHAYKNPHNRPTAMDGIEDPMEGWVSGGPYAHFLDADALRILEKGTAPMKCHADHVGSYSTNEITIYWNSPAIFATAYLNS